jgi:oxygen-dependent protoporphyrinogen oxidase
MSARVVVIGGGISGLTTAFWLHRAGIDVTVLESGDAPGGTMRTIRDGEWLVESGPNSALETTPLFADMFRELGLEEERAYADPAGNKRYILRNGRLHPLPMSPGLLLRTKLWSKRGLLRICLEPFIGRADHEESIAQFVERRLGREMLDYAINPFVAGVYAGNPESLSVRAAFPKLYALEEKYGGLIKGMLLGARDRKKRAEKAKDRAKLLSFRSGMETFPAAIGRFLGNRVRCGVRVVGVLPPGRGAAEASPVFTVEAEAGGKRERIEAGRVVLAVPAYVAAPLVRPFAPSLAGLLDNVYYPPVVEVFTGYRAEQIHRPLDGFGYLIPAVEKRKILGTIWSSVLFPGRAPEGHAAFTTFVGGSRQPELTQGTDAEILASTTSELRDIMGITGEPAYTRLLRWDRAIPQYALGYHRTLETIDHTERDVPGLFFCSNYRGGIAVGDCLMGGERIAGRVKESLSSISTPSREVPA